MSRLWDGLPSMGPASSGAASVQSPHHRAPKHDLRWAALPLVAGVGVFMLFKLLCDMGLSCFAATRRWLQ